MKLSASGNLVKKTQKGLVVFIVTKRGLRISYKILENWGSCELSFNELEQLADFVRQSTSQTRLEFMRTVQLK